MHMGHSANMTTVCIISWMVDGFSFLFPGRSTGGIWEWTKEDQHGNYGNIGWLPKAICQRFQASEYSLCSWLQHSKYPGSSEEANYHKCNGHVLVESWARENNGTIRVFQPLLEFELHLPDATQVTMDRLHSKTVQATSFGLEHHTLLSRWELGSLFADKGLLSLWHCLGQPDQPLSLSYAQHYNKKLINFDTTRERFLPDFCSSGNLSSLGCR